jgi:hypothetical protein
VVSLNVTRRHLTPSQKAALALEISPALEAEARARQRTSTGGTKPQLLEKVPQAEKGTARAQAAKLVGVNERYVAQERIQAADPELLKQVRTGDRTLTDARRLCAMAERAKEAKALREGHAAQWPVRERAGHILPLEALWRSPRQRLIDFISDYPDSLKRAFSKFREQATVSHFDFDDPARFPDRVIAGAREMGRVFDECLETLLAAADRFTDQCLAAVEETSDVKIPAAKREHAAWLLETNRWQKNYEGWCAELGCWAVVDTKAAEQTGTNCGDVYCPEHAELPHERCTASERCSQTPRPSWTVWGAEV